MLFNSAVFIFGFLPVTLLGYGLLTRFASRRAAIGWLVAASLIYYGWWEFFQPAPSGSYRKTGWYLLLIGFSIAFNFTVGRRLRRVRLERGRRALLAVGVAVNLALLGYFKYAGFLADSFEALFNVDIHLSGIVLPLAISFFTFQQIAYLVDTFRGLTAERRFLDYCLFVTFFPQLIAGPIVHHSEMMPQFTRRGRYRMNAADFSVGLTMFTFGLAKKVLIADHMATWATPIFDMAHRGEALTVAEAWCGALAYGFQIYYDFSGYTDMAMGLARCVGIRLPLNFASPYKAANIIDFWRRWHITLSRFLRDYLYIPLGGNRKGKARRYVNLMVTMLLGGLWHGANWTFVVWGGLHGLYLVVNHAWHAVRRRFGSEPGTAGPVARLLGCALTFLAVTVAWVFFRAGEFADGNFATAWRVLRGMAGADGLGFAMRIDLDNAEAWLAFLAVVTWLCPNTQQVMGLPRPALGSRVTQRLREEWWVWRPNVVWACATGGLLLVSVWYATNQSSEFIYYQF